MACAQARKKRQEEVEKIRLEEQQRKQQVIQQWSLMLMPVPVLSLSLSLSLFLSFLFLSLSLSFCFFLSFFLCLIEPPRVARASVIVRIELKMFSLIPQERELKRQQAVMLKEQVSP